MRHPLLAASIVSGSDVGSVRFAYTMPGSAEEAMRAAKNEMSIEQGSKDGEYGQYMEDIILM
jgi:hypothetical protein